MFYTYVLQSQINKRFYIGHTHNLEDRLSRHNSRREKSTKAYAPWNLVLTKEFETRSEAVQFEMKLKSIKNKKYLSELFSIPV